MQLLHKWQHIAPGHASSSVRHVLWPFASSFPPFEDDVTAAELTLQLLN